MSYHALLEYVRAAKNRGADDAEITRRLSAGGWYGVDIQDALALDVRLASAHEPSRLQKTERHHSSPCHSKATNVAVFLFISALLAYIWLIG